MKLTLVIFEAKKSRFLGMARPTGAVSLMLIFNFQSACGDGGATRSAPSREGGQDGVPDNGGRPTGLSVASGDTHACALSDGELWCWGSNTWGALGARPVGYAGLPRLVEGFDTDLVSLYAAKEHTCTISSSGALRCMGSTDQARLGASNDSGRLVSTTETPVEIAGLPMPVSDLAIGGGHMCALVDGDVWCWGRTETGPWAEDALSERGEPERIGGLPGKASDVEAVAGRTCVIVNGGVYCWDGDASSSWVAVEGLETGVTALSLGPPHCAIKDDAVHCWGPNRNGQLGVGTFGEESEVPLAVVGLPAPVTAIDTGEHFACAIAAGEVHCWGRNQLGQLGNGTTDDSATPARVAGLASVSALSVGDSFACAVADRRVSCWGNNRFQALGGGRTPDQPFRSSPVEVPGLP